MNSKLKPCPFCGGKATLNGPYSFCWIRCKECGIGTDFVGDAKDTIADWNRRVTDTNVGDNMEDDGR